MSKITKVKTGSKFEEIASYSRLVEIDNWIMVSNTAGRNPETQEFSDDVVEQTEQVLNNIEQALKTVNARLADVVRSRIFIQNRDDIHKVMAYIGTRFRGVDPAITATCPPLGADYYKVEIEVTAYRGASNAEVEIITTV